jgi:signal transduction histidine kinase/CheY-like chemotaxis protein
VKLDTRTFTSKVARRAFVLFVGCALLPVSVLAVLSFRQVTAELHQQSERRLRQASKAVGLALHRRLLELAVAIDPRAQQIWDQLDQGRERPFVGVVLVTPDGRTRSLSGRMSELPTLTPEQARHVAAGKTLVSTAPHEAGPWRFFVSRAVDRQHPDAGTLYGEVNPVYIWGVEDDAALEPGTKLIVLDESGRLLFSSFGGSVPVQVSTQARRGSAGQFTWSDDAHHYLASYWSLFLKNEFLTPKWTIVLNRSTSDVFAPIADFRRTFVLVGLVSLLIVLFLSLRQIRKILQPLDRLQDATRRLALGRLDTRVEVASRDEFEELARSFNQMAGQLGRQFDALTMRSEITVALSRSERLEAVLESCLEILVRHLDLAVAGVWLTGTDEAILERRAIAGAVRPTDGTHEHVAVGLGEIGRVAAESRPYATNTLLEDPRRSEPAWSSREGLVAFVGHPLLIEGRVLGVAAAYATRPLDVTDLGGIGSAAGAIAQGIERRRVADALQGSEEQVRQLQKMEAVGRLAGGIAHDFNNLLTVIMGYSHLLLRDLASGDPRRENIRIIETTAERASQLTRQLLAFSRKQVLAPTLLDINTVVTEMIAILNRLIGPSIELVFTPAEDPGLVEVDRGQIEQVIVNLVINARDAMPDGGRITVETAAVDLDERGAAQHPGSSRGRHVMLRITDTGTGMDADTRARIFEPFFTTKEPGKGTGLGLATVYGIVAQSGGSIRVDSALGQGTSFTLHFPLAAGTVKPPPLASLPAARGDETVLLVDDEHEVRRLLQQILEDHGYVVMSAGRPSEALRIAEHHPGPIHLLLTDMVMPEMSGAVLAARLGVTRPEMMVLQMSGYSDYGSGVGEPSSAPPAFLQKPFTPDTVARAVRAVLDAAGARR